MKTKERPAPVPESLTPEDSPVSYHPIFDLERARIAHDTVGYWVESKIFPALKVALTLAVYNSQTLGFREDASQSLARKLQRLARDEIGTSSSQNPLPTIGFEVETPRKPFETRDYSPIYAKFFDLIGMPRNKVNNRDYSNNSQANTWPHWEFSPPPAYTASVQARTLSELIRGSFIPSLKFSQNPDDVKEYLDNKLVSLHINLGVPTSMEEGLKGTLTKSRDALIFVSAFAFAFTSERRLLNRAQMSSPLLEKKEGVLETLKSSNLRFEMKPFEVRAESTYNSLKKTPLLSGDELRSLKITFAFGE